MLTINTKSSMSYNACLIFLQIIVFIIYMSIVVILQFATILEPRCYLLLSIKIKKIKNRYFFLFFFNFLLLFKLIKICYLYYN